MHSGAFGASLPDANVEEFIKQSNELLKDYNGEPIYLVDFIYQANNIDMTTILEIPQLGYLWGQNFKEPLVAVENIKLNKDNVLYYPKDTSGTLKVKLNDDLELIKFNVSQQEYETLYSEFGCITINVIGTCQLNEFLGRTNPEIFITDYEIVDRINYYF